MSCSSRNIISRGVYKKPKQCFIDAVLFCFLISSLNGFSQSIKRQTVASSVGSKSTDGVRVSQTVGQPYHTQTNQSGGISYRPGFQQPVFKTELIESTLNVSIVPNPAFYSFFIESSDTLKQAVLATYDEAGKLVYSEKIEFFKKHEVHCANWANGIYVITVTDKKNNLISTKLIKQQ